MSSNDLSRTVKEFILPVNTILHVEHTIEEALASLRGRKIEEKIIYFYVVDAEGRLQGVVPTRKLLLSDPKRKVQEIMIATVARLRENHSLHEAMELLSKHELLALPVVDGDQRLTGIIDIQIYLDESVDIANTRHRSDMFQILGANATRRENEHSLEELSDSDALDRMQYGRGGCLCDHLPLF